MKGEAQFGSEPNTGSWLAARVRQDNKNLSRALHSSDSVLAKYRQQI